MTAAELTDEWIGRTVAVHDQQPPIVGRLVAWERVRRLVTLDRSADRVAVTLHIPEIDRVMSTMLRPDTIITDQEEADDRS